MSNRVKIGYWAKKLGFTCKECYEYALVEDCLHCPLQVKLSELKEEYDFSDIIDMPASKPRKPILRTFLTDFFSDFDKSKILREREMRELKTNEEIRYEEYKKFLAEMKEIENKIQKCLNRNHYLAVVKGKDRFRDQHFWIADCRFCENYWNQYDFCMVYYELKNRRGICPLYKFGKSFDSKLKEAEE